MLIGDGFIRLQPTRPGLDSHGRDSRPRATSRGECIMNRHGAHLVSPDKQRVGRVGTAQVVVACPLDDEFDVMLSSEVHGSHDVAWRFSCDGVGTDASRPGVLPAGGLGRSGLFFEIERVLHVFQSCGTCGSLCADHAGFEWR